uniref:Uncharacterized protein AlNc14C149G7476 n=1 Tax=Albugo laibachii Nc14 TaxID=890382 RepID=F0WLW3_9STRA|nr:conserved hypothetical protein [Albugo laibachii Nc14]|eukprot:CCA22289.1 conserved hypothetical protein [Albugo laibachii Nc14]
MSDNALALKATHIKALQQRAKALMKLNQFQLARCDLVKALQINKDEGADDSLRERLQSQMCDLERAKREERKRNLLRMEFDTNMMHKAVGKLYQDKPQTCGNVALLCQKQPIFTTFGVRVVISVGFFILALELLRRGWGELL